MTTAQEQFLYILHLKIVKRPYTYRERETEREREMLYTVFDDHKAGPQEAYQVC